MNHDPILPEDDELARKIIGAAIEVHRTLGPGLLEKIYERALCHELRRQDILCESQKEILVPYKEIQIPGQQLDLLVGGRVIVEIKAVAEFHPLHQAQLLSYLKATNLRLGLLINFHVPVLKEGIKRVVR